MSIEAILIEKMSKKYNKVDYLIENWRAQGIGDERIYKAFKEIKREDFIPKELRKEAYRDAPLPIYENQTISQPSTIIEMLELLDVKEDSKILEIGTGSGYNAALLSKLTAKTVYSIERIKKLAEFAKSNLKKAKIKNVEVIYGDGSKGYAKEAPYDRIIATCAAKEIPNAWKEQLNEKGIIVAPVGRENDVHVMIAIQKINSQLISRRVKGQLYTFVPLVKGSSS